MKSLHVLSISALSLLMLAACEQKTQSSVVTTSAPVTSTASAVTASAPVSSTQTLASANGKISIQTQGQFSDKLPQAADLISDIPAEQLLLLQQDESADVLVYATDLGTAKSNSQNYLTKLSDAIKADAKLKDVSVAAAQNSQLAYQFSEVVGDATINQACQAIHQQNIYSICAISTTQASSQLAKVIENVTIQ